MRVRTTRRIASALSIGLIPAGLIVLFAGVLPLAHGPARASSTHFPWTPALQFVPEATTINQFPTSTGQSGPEFITSGPDGNLWFTENTANKIGTITPSGAVTEFPVPTANSGLTGITAGPDGNLWFVEHVRNQVGRITTKGVITEFSGGVKADPSLIGITGGPDGNLWFTSALTDQLGRITPQGVVTLFNINPGGTNPLNPNGITTGPDGNIWFVDSTSNDVGQFDILTKSVQRFPIPAGQSNPAWITTGPDGNLWFTERLGDQIGRITPTGTITEFGVPTKGAQPFDITSGPDGAVYATEEAGSKIIRADLSAPGLSLGDLTPSAVVLTEIPLAVGAAGQTPAGITTGPDNNVWFAEFSISAIGRLSPGTPPPSADIAVSIQAPATIGTGDQLTSTITVTNSGPQTANNVTAVFDVPNGTTFVSAKGSGVIQPPAAGGNGTLTDSLGSLASGTAASFQVTLNVGGAQGSSIVANASASTTSTDPNTANNSAAATIAVKGGGVVMFVLTQPTPTAAVPFPAPIVTTIVPGSGTPPSADDTLAPQEIQPQDDTCGAPIGQNYYMAPDCNATMLPTDPHSFPWVFQGSTVQNPGGGNVFVPTVGAVYIVTNVFQCAGPPASTVESLASNIVSVCGGPTITGFKLKAGKFRIFGTNFASNAAVFINSTKATGKLVRSTTVLLLKGAILSQVPIGTSLISVEQPGSSTTFGISTFTLDRTQ